MHRDDLPKRFIWILAIVIFGLIIASAVAMALFAPHRCAEVWWLKDIRDAARENPPWIIISSIAAAPALVLTWWWRTAHKDVDIAQAKRNERNERFFEAVKLLADGKPLASFGGVYSLEALVRDAPYEYQRVVETLCAFIRGKAEEGPEGEPLEGITPEVQAAFSVVGGCESQLTAPNSICVMSISPTSRVAVSIYTVLI